MEKQALNPTQKEIIHLLEHYVESFLLNNPEAKKQYDAADGNDIIVKAGLSTRISFCKGSICLRGSTWNSIHLMGDAEDGYIMLVEFDWCSSDGFRRPADWVNWVSEHISTLWENGEIEREEEE